MRAILMLGLLLAGCASTPEQQLAEERRHVATELRDELSVGREMAAKLYGHFGRKPADKRQLEYVNLVGRTLAALQGRPELSFRFGILDTDEVNAFATPGGFVLVTRGLLAQIRNESELAAVLAHEIAHINERHMYLSIVPKREVSAEESLSRIMSRGRSELGKSMVVLADQGLKMLLEDGLGKEKEQEADQAALLFVAQLGYNPHAMVELMQRLQANQANLEFGKVAQPFAERITGMKQLLSQQGIANRMTADAKVLHQRFAAAWGKTGAN